MSYLGMGGAVDYVSFIRHIESKGFVYLGQGSFRSVYQRGKMVIKVPRNKDGINDNRTEATAWHKYKSHPTTKGYRLAPCRMLPNGCQMMVVVDRYVVTDILHKEEWTHKIESGQVGMYRNQAVAYDFALNIVERAEWEERWDFKSEWFYANNWNNPEYQ